MDFIQAMRSRHSVRRYLDKPIDPSTVTLLNDYINACNDRSGLSMKLITNEPKAFGSFLAHYGKFSGVTNYVALVGAPNMAQKCGYYGQKVVLYAQTLGLNTCWVGLTYSKVRKAYTLAKGEKTHLVIAIGYGQTQGVPHKSKTPRQVSACLDPGPPPDWFTNGVQAALLAPTAVNQQKFRFTLSSGEVTATTARGFFSEVDLGIAKLHFDLGSGKSVFEHTL